MKPWQKRKPHSQDPEYVASMRRRRDGGWVVITDRRTESKRWIVTINPGCRGMFWIAVTSQAVARELMKRLATAKDVHGVLAAFLLEHKW